MSVSMFYSRDNQFIETLTAINSELSACKDALVACIGEYDSSWDGTDSAVYFDKINEYINNLSSKIGENGTINGYIIKTKKYFDSYTKLDNREGARFAEYASKI